jgi:hypothetical protein
MKKLLIFAFCFLLTLLCNTFIYSQVLKVPAIVQKADTTFKGIQIPSNYIFKVGWSKKSFHSIELNNSSSNFFKQDGNNFYGFTLENRLQFTEYVSLIPSFDTRFGNIAGNFAYSGSLLPNLALGLGLNNSLDVYGGIGPSFLLIFGEGNSKYGGYGFSSVLGIQFHIYEAFGFYVHTGYESYGNQSYQTYGVGISIYE